MLHFYDILLMVCNCYISYIALHLANILGLRIDGKYFSNPCGVHFGGAPLYQFFMWYIMLLLVGPLKGFLQYIAL